MPTSSTPPPAGRACRGCTACAGPCWSWRASRTRAVPLLNARLLAARLPDARVHVVPGGGHLFLLDEPQSVAPQIRAFLDAPD